MRELTKEQEEALTKIFYEEKLLYGRDKLYQIVKDRDLGISRRQVQKYLNEQEIYQLFKPTKKAKTIQSTVLNKPYQQIGIDLIDVRNIEEGGIQYLLNGVDLFSKKAVSIPLKNKTDKVVSQAMIKLYESFDNKIRSVRHDQGSEFLNKLTQKVLKDLGVKSIKSNAYTPQSNGAIERFHKTLKNMILKVKRLKGEWLDSLEEIIEGYNNLQHDTTKTTPNQLLEHPELNEEVHKRIEEKANNRPNENRVMFEVGDTVRIAGETNEIGQKWSKELYTVERVFKPQKTFTVPYYKIKGRKEKYYNNDLQKVVDVKNSIKENKKYIVSKLIKPVIRGGVQGYIVQWRGYPAEKDFTFEPRENLLEDVPKMIRQYEKNNNVKFYASKVQYDK